MLGLKKLNKDYNFFINEMLRRIFYRNSFGIHCVNSKILLTTV